MFAPYPDPYVSSPRNDVATELRRGPLPPVPPTLPLYFGRPIDTPPGHRWAGPRETVPADPWAECPE